MEMKVFSRLLDLLPIVLKARAPEWLCLLYYIGMASPGFWIEINLLNFHVLVRRGLFCCHDLLHNVMYMYNHVVHGMYMVIL